MSLDKEQIWMQYYRPCYFVEPEIRGRKRKRKKEEKKNMIKKKERMIIDDLNKKKNFSIYCIPRGWKGRIG